MASTAIVSCLLPRLSTALLLSICSTYESLALMQVLPLDQWVLNTEAHPLPILKPGRKDKQRSVLPVPKVDLEGQQYSTAALQQALAFYRRRLPRAAFAADASR